MAASRADSCPNDDALSSFGDSSYDFIDDRSFTATDDEGTDDMMASVTSSDGQGQPLEPSNASRVAPLSPPSTEQDELPAQAFEVRGPLRIPPFARTQGMEASQTLDGNPIICHESIPMPKAASGRPELVEVSHHLGSTIDLAQSPSGAPVMDISVRQTLGTRHLDIGCGPYRILYVGSQDSQDLLLHKIAAVLATTQTPYTPVTNKFPANKFNIVPISAFGGSQPPEVVLIDSTGIQLEIDECIEASCGTDGVGDLSIELKLSNGLKVKSAGSDATPQLSGAWNLPDLAIVSSASSDEDISQRTCQSASKFLNRYGVPILMVTSTRSWETSLDLETLSPILPHLCLENKVARPTVMRRVPIDIHTFLKLDTGQLNRSLACLIPSASTAGPLRITSSGTNVNKAEKDSTCPLSEDKATMQQMYRASVRLLHSSRSAWIIILFFILSAVLAPVARLAFFGSGDHVLRTKVPLDASVRNGVACDDPQAISSNPARSSGVGDVNSPSSIVPTLVQNLTQGTAVASLALGQPVKPWNEAEHFKAHLVGDNHVILMAPYWFLNLRKAPRLSSTVSREGTPLHHDLHRLSDGAFALKLPIEEAYGIVNARIWASSRPAINQTFDLDFGSAWLRPAAWKKVVLVSTQALQSSLQDQRFRVHGSIARAFPRLTIKMKSFTWGEMLPAKPALGLEHTAVGTVLRRTRQVRGQMVDQAWHVTWKVSRRIDGGLRSANAQMRQLNTVYVAQRTFNLRQSMIILVTDWRKWYAETQSAIPRKSLAGIADQGSLLIHRVQKMSWKVWWRARGIQDVPEASSTAFRRGGVS